jgi:hypothetical protein
VQVAVVCAVKRLGPAQMQTDKVARPGIKG